MTTLGGYNSLPNPPAVGCMRHFDGLAAETVVFEIVARCPKHCRCVDFKERLPRRIGLLDVPDVKAATRRFTASNALANLGSLVSVSLDPALRYVALTRPVSCRAIRKARVAVKWVPRGRQWFCRRRRRPYVRPT